ncbi:hypothetical protein ID866_7582 [Astraeus odoratus]|nr:hypothetical protein ID866_7582 [Astraeus odoratus]
MRRLLGSKAGFGKGRERQEDPEDQASASIPMPSPVEVHVAREVYTSNPDDQDSPQPLPSTSTLVPPSPSGSAKKQLPPGIRVPTHPYPYWQHHHTPSSSQSSLESPVTPSHVSWISGSSPNLPGPSTPTSTSHPSPSAPAPGRSSPNLFFPPPPATAPPPNASKSKPAYPSKSSHSLRGPMQEFFAQQLSPIVEQDYMSPEKRPASLPSSSHDGSGTRTSTTHTMMTPISPASPVLMNPIFSAAGGSVPTPAGPAYGGLVPFVKRKEEDNGDSPRPSPVFSTFLSRPLNRTISLSSTRTHQSSLSSSTPPVIPPLDLRPAFPGPFLPANSPISPTSRGFWDGLGTFDGESSSGRRESFITARSAGARESRYSSTQQEHYADALETLSSGQHSRETPKSSPQRPEVPDLSQVQVPQPPPPAHLSPVTSHPPSCPQQSGQHEHPHRPTAPTPSLRSFTSTPSASSSFIDKRFADSELYLGSAAERASARQAGQRWTLRTESVDTTQLLFWVGFIAPWCWLIGGWLVQPRRTPPYTSRQRDPSLLPLWTGKGKSVQSVNTINMHHGYPFVAPSTATLTPPACAPRVMLTPKPLQLAKNPWVRRCRIAAITSGVLILVAFVIALIVAGRGSG